MTDFARHRTTAETEAANIRAEGHAIAIRHLVNGHRAMAFYSVMSCFNAQAAALGLHLHEGAA